MFIRNYECMYITNYQCMYITNTAAAKVHEHNFKRVIMVRSVTEMYFATYIYIIVSGR